MIGHGEIADPHAHTIATPHHQRVNAGKHAAVPGPQVEIGHGHDLGQITAGVNVVAAHEKDEIAVDTMQLGIPWVNNEKSHHSHRHLHHLVGMRVIHERSALLEREFVDEGLARLDVRLCQSADAVHSVRHQHAVPMNGCVLWQLVGDEDTDLVAFHALEGWPGRLPVVTPQMRLHAGRDLARHRLRDQMEFLPVAIHAPGQCPTVQRDDRLIGGPA